MSQQDLQSLREPRTNMFISAALHWAGQSAPVTLRNLSPVGALVEGAVLPVEGMIVRLVRGPLAADGDVAWSTGRRCGVRIHDTVDVGQWMARPGQGQQSAIEQLTRDAQPGAIAAGPMATAPIHQRVGEQSPTSQLRDLERLLLDISDDLGSDPETAARYSAQLQKLDLLAQGLARLRGSIRQA